LKQNVVDALWELSGKYDVDVWYEHKRVGTWVNQYDVFCGVVVRLGQPHCRMAEECVEEMLRDYKREVEKMKEPPKPPPPDPAEGLLREWPELQAFGVEWVRKWLVLRDRVEIAKVLRRFPWMVEVIKQRPMSILHPYMVEAYVTRDGSETCLSLNPPKAFCARDGAVKEVRLELIFSRYDTYEDKIKRGVQTQGTVGVYHGGERIREGALAAFPSDIFTSKIGVLNCIYSATPLGLCGVEDGCVYVKRTVAMNQRQEASP